MALSSVPCDIKVLDRLIVVNLCVSIWSARKKLTAADFGGAQLPPEDLASWGSKKICDPESLRIFGTLKSRAVNYLDRLGIRFLNGWAVPDDKAQELHDKLYLLHNEFSAAKDDFLFSYDQAVRAWVDKHPGWEQLISTSTVSADYVRSRLGFGWQFFKIAQPDHNAFSENLVGEVKSLSLTLFDEISKEARKIWSKVYAGKTEVSHKALSPLKALHQKLSGLSFVEPRVLPVTDLIEAAMVNLPKRGLITGSHLVMLQGLVSMLSDPSLLLEHGQKIINGHTTASILSGLTDDASETEFTDKQNNADSTQPSAINQQYVDSLGLW